jgi:hypothetical protein
MLPETRELLLSVDCPEGWEEPQTYLLDYDGIWRDIRELKVQIEDIIGQPLTIDEWVQDASFITDLYILSPSARRGSNVTVLIFDFCIRFSAFGELFTIFATGQKLDRERFQVPEIVGVVEAKGFRYVNAEELHEPYDGKNLAMREDPTRYTWWLRYFDYV